MVTIFALVISLGSLIAGISLTRNSLKVRGWPVVPGRIVDRGVGPRTTAGASGTGRTFEPWVKYGYTVAGKSYTGQRIGLTTDAYDHDTARRVVDRLSEEVAVHYNPDAPGDAYLEPSALTLGLLIAIGGGTGVLISAGLLIAKLASG